MTNGAFEALSLTIEKTYIDEHETHYQLYSIDAGYATALGNALRRVLLASLPGAAITSVRIQEAQHEFQDITEILEDVTDIVFQLKKVRLRCYADHPVKMHVDVQGRCEVTAGDILVPGTVEIVNPELHLATLDNENAHLVMELVVSTGRGFVSADEQAAYMTEAPPIGVILTDAIYSPIVKAHFFIEPLYQEKHDPTASIHLEITTDGTISPDEALRQSATILERQFAVFAHYRHKDEAETWKRPSSSDVPIPSVIYHTPIEDLHLSPRAFNCLRRSGITTIGPLLEMEETDLLGIHNVGKKSIEEITTRLLAMCFVPTPTREERIPS